MKIPPIQVTSTPRPANGCEDDPEYLKLDQLDLADNPITLQEVHSATITIAKFRKISKLHQTSLKKKYNSVNRMFCEMSSFFVSRRQKLGLSKQQRMMRTELRNKATLRKKNQSYHQLLNLVAADSSNSSHIARQQKQGLQNAEDEPYEQNPKVGPKTSKCYICLGSYTEIDDIYHQHCPTCAAQGKEKRFQTCNLLGLTALVTGARLKIGYQIVLKLLRDGAFVYATTRFVKDALIRYQQELDYPQFKDRLVLIQCDFLSSEQVTSLIRYIQQRVQHLDILIHNAAQTISRPPSFYTFELLNQSIQNQNLANPSGLVYFSNQARPSLQMQSNKALTNIENGPEVDLERTDQFGQPLDLRIKNTWRQKIEDVSLFDCMSTQLINSTVPFYITGQLRSVMGGNKPSWVINVSSMEGVFYRQYKSCFHPHTNMAKASLNMMTRTCAQDMSKVNIYLNSVDTGWVTNQNPLLLASRMATKYDFAPPLDCVEGAMRVLDPIYQGVKQGKYIYGKFLKNYRESLW